MDTPPILSPRMVRRGMNRSILSAVLLSFFITVSGGALFSGMLLSIKLTNPQIGFVMSLPLLFPAMQIAGAYIQRTWFHRKRFWIFCSLASYGFYGLLAGLVTVWFRLPEPLAFPFFVIFYALVLLFTQLPGSTHLSWLGELVPRRESAAFWSRRTGLAGITSMIGGVSLGKLADLLGRESSMTYVGLLAVGIAFGLFATWAFAGAPDPDPAPRPGGGFFSLIGETLKNRDYRRLTVFFSYQSLFAWLSNGFIFVYLQKGMNFSMMTIQIMLAISALVAFLSGYFFRIVGAKYGRKPVLILCSVLKALEFVLWGTLLPHNSVLDTAGAYLINSVVGLWGGAPVELPAGALGAVPLFLVGGFVNMGIASAQMSLLTSLGNKKIQSMAIGLFSTIVGLCGAATGAVSGYCYDFLGTQTLLPTGELTPFNILALCSAFGFLSSVFFLSKFHEDGAAPVQDMVRTLLSQNPIRAVYQANLLSQPMTEGGRVDMLSQSAGNLVAGEVARSLWNPSSRVRDGALLSLSRTGDKPVDPALLEEVIKLLHIPELGMQAMAARTLGRLRAAAAVPALIDKLGSEDLALAQSSVFALGLIGSEDALAALRQVLSDGRRRELWPLAAEAVSKLGDWRDAEAVLKAYEGETFHVTRRQCLIALVRSALAERKKIYPAFESEEKFPGSELERYLKLFCQHEWWQGQPGSAPDFGREMTLCDHEEFLPCAASLLAAELQVFLPGSSPGDATDEQWVSERFAPGGRFREPLFSRGDYPSTALGIQLKLWAQLKYSARDGEERMILLALLLIGCALFDDKIEDKDSHSRKHPPEKIEQGLEKDSIS